MKSSLDLKKKQTNPNLHSVRLVQNVKTNCHKKLIIMDPQCRDKKKNASSGKDEKDLLLLYLG